MSIWNDPAYIKQIQEAATRKKKVKEVRRRLRPFGEKYREEGEKFKVLARPHERRRKIETTYAVNLSQSFQVIIRAVTEENDPVDVTRIWTTINGKNRDIRRPSKGKGEYGELGPYAVDYKPTDTGISKLKVQVAGDLPAIIYYKVKKTT